MGALEPAAPADRPASEPDPTASPSLAGLKHRDLQTIAHLEAMGGDVTVPRHLIFYLYFDEKSDAKAAGRSLRRHGFSVNVHQPLKQIPQWAAVAERRNKAIVPDFLRQSNQLCAHVASRNNGEYDGWEAGLTEEEKETRRG
jgi:hypothetical protein